MTVVSYVRALDCVVLVAAIICLIMLARMLIDADPPPVLPEKE